MVGCATVCEAQNIFPHWHTLFELPHGNVPRIPWPIWAYHIDVVHTQATPTRSLEEKHSPQRTHSSSRRLSSRRIPSPWRFPSRERVPSPWRFPSRERVPSPSRRNVIFENLENSSEGSLDNGFGRQSFSGSSGSHSDFSSN